MDPFDYVEEHDLGFYQLREIPDAKELELYYSKKYYQESKGTYKKNYAQEDLELINLRLDRKVFLIHNNLRDSNNEFLDIGCGEGWAMRRFFEDQWQVTGLDYSDAGVRQINPEMEEFVQVGDIHKSIDSLQGRKYTVILLDNVLEHVRDPEYLVSQIRPLLTSSGLLMIEVPNDFSNLQLDLIHSGDLRRPHWVISPDHINYFSLQSLTNLLTSISFEFVDAITEFPIDLFLTNSRTNYYQTPAVGPSVHQSRIRIERLMANTSLEQSVNVYRELIKLGLGRNIVGLFRKR